MFFCFQIGQHLEIIAQRQGGMARLGSQEAVIKAAAIADAVALRIEGQAGHQHQSCFIVAIDLSS